MFFFRLTNRAQSFLQCLDCLGMLTQCLMSVGLTNQALSDIPRITRPKCRNMCIRMCFKSLLAMPLVL